MRHTTELRSEAARAEAALDVLDPALAPADDPRELRLVGLAARKVQRVDAELRAAVRAARAAGYTWADIGLTLGTTRQAAQARFREAPASAGQRGSRA